MEFIFKPVNNQKISDQELIDDIKRVAKIYGRTITMEEYSTDGKYSVSVIGRHFNGWQKALDTADLPRTKNIDIPEEELIKDLLRVANELGRSPTREDYDVQGKYSEGTLRKRFGGWLPALKKAGLAETNHHLRIPEKKLFENLEAVWLNLGKQPRMEQMCKPLSRYSGRVYQNRYGGWNNALQAFIDFVNDPQTEDIEHADVEFEKATDIYKHKTSRQPNLRLRWKVMTRDNYQCTACGRVPRDHPGLELHIDHITPWSRGGETVLENLSLKCSDCNLGKSDT